MEEMFNVVFVEREKCIYLFFLLCVLSVVWTPGQANGDPNRQQNCVFDMF